MGQRTSETAVSLLWSDASETESGFQIEYRTGAQEQWSNGPILPANTEAGSVSGLSTGALYDFRIAATNSHGTSRSGVLRLNLSTAPPMAPALTGVAERHGGRVQARLNWPLDPSSGVMFEVQHRQAGTADWRPYQTITNRGTGQNQILVDVSPPTTRDYRVVATNGGGRVPSNVITLHLESFRSTLPVSPGDLAAFALTTSSAQLTWNDEASNETSYRAYSRLRGSTAWTEHPSLAANSEATVITGLPESSAVEIRVAATNAQGSAFSRHVSVDLSVTPPEIVLTADVVRDLSTGEVQVELAWTIDAASEDPTYLVVENRRTGHGWEFYAVLGASARSYTFLDTWGTLHDFRVEASNRGGRVRSNVVSVDVRKVRPKSPTATAAKQAGPTEILLTWSDESADEDGFDISYDFRNERFEYARVPADAESVRVTGLAAGAYKFSVKAFNDYGDGQSRVVAHANLPTPAPLPPSAASGLAARVRSPTRVDLSWTDSATDETGFDVLYRPDPGDWTALPVAEDSESATVQGLTKGATYVFRVLAKSSHGSLNSNWITVDLAPDLIPPDGAPSSLTGTASLAGQTAEVDLRWTDNSSDETGFVVEYRTWNSTTWTTAATLAANVTAVKLTGLSPATRYVFRVSATRNSARSDALEWQVRTPGDGPPTGPAGSLRVEARGFTSIFAEWSDNSISETGYTVEIKTGTSEYRTVANLPANVTRFTITNLLAGTAYTVRVGAVNRHGTAWSTERSTSTSSYPVPAAPANLEGATLSETSARLTWSDRATDERGYEVHYKRSGTSLWATYRTLPAESDSATLTGLSAGGRFDFRVAALGLGLPSHSNVTTVDLGVAPPSAELSGRVVRVGQQAQAALTWTVKGTADSIDVTYRRPGESSWTLSETVDGSATTAHFASSGTAFELRLKVWGAGGRGFSNTIVVDLSRAPPVAPSGILVQGDGLGGANLWWTDSSSTETAFVVEFGSGAERMTYGVYPAQPGNSGIWLKGLGPGNWSVHVSSRNEYGSSHGGSATISLTAPFTVQPAANVTATIDGSTSALVDWDDTDGEAGYIVSYRRDDGAWQELNVAANAYFRRITNLTQDALYHFRIVAWTGAGYAGSSIVSLDLSRRKPAAPQNLTAVARDATTAKLTWEDHSANETAFEVRYREGNSWLRYGRALQNAETARLTGLTPGRRYRFAVSARNSHGESATSTANLRMPQGDLPSAPTNVSVAVLSATSAAITWQDNSSTKFQLEYRTGEALWTRMALAAGATTTTLVGLEGSRSYEVRVGAKNSKGTAFGDPLRFTLSSPPVFPPGTVTIRIPEGTTGAIGSPVVATPSMPGGTVAYSLTGTDALSFEVSSTGQISVASGTTLNHEQKASYAFNVVASDGATPALTATRAVTVTVTDVDESLTITGLANGTVAENAVYTSAAPTVSGHRGAVTWTKEGTDAADFTISASGGLSMVARDYEDPADDDVDNVYEVTVKATDADGITGTAAITVTVTDVDESPTFSTATALAISVPEGTTGNVGSPVTASDPEGASLTYSLTGTDAASFDVSSTGQLSLASGVTLNHEQKASYAFNVVVSDGATPALTATRAVTVTVTDVDESLTITGLANGTVAENAVYASAAPTVTGHRGAVTWTKEGTDAADFTISASGVLSMVARDYEDPADHDENNVYEVTVKATDADNITGTAAITVTVTNVNEAPAFATATALAISVPEGTTGNIGSPVAASDPEGASLTYSLTGTDAASFDVSSAGQLSLASGTTLNHEQKASYSFNVVVSDGATPALTATRAVTVTVTDVDESLTITGLANGTVAENAVYTSAAPTVTGHRGAVTWTKEGTDAADFTISSSGVLSMVARDYEDPVDDDEDNVYEVTVKATDADGITGTATITVTVTNVNEAPAFATATALAISVPEGTTGNVGSPVTATDPEGASLAYSLTGTDAASFDVSSTGQISAASGTTLNHEQKSSYSLTVVASDGATPALTATRAVTVTVTDVDESLTITGLANGTVAENAVYTSPAPTVSGHRGAVTWTKEGTDAADFTISGSGVLSMVARDYEDPADDDENNLYEVTVKATDADGIAGTAAITVTVTNVNEAPAFATATALAISVPEGTTGNVGSPVTATDPEGASLAYSLTGTDAASFDVSSTGQISVASGTTLNHEQKASYAFSVVVSDGATPALTATRAVTVTVTDVDESLTITGLANGTVAENAVYASAAPTVTGHRGAVTWTKEGTDAADFTISASGVLSMVARDYEDPADHDENNVYEVTVKATDADNITGTAAITVTVTNVNEAPAFATATALAISVPEGTTGNIGSPVAASDPEGASLTYSLTGTDAASFDVSSAGQLSLASGTTLNHEQKASYSFNVVVSDGATPALTATRAVTVTVTDVDESLTITGLANGTVAENAVYTSAAPTVTGHRGAVTWTKEGTDAADFTISSSGVLSMVARDYEDPVDDDEDNVYEVTVKATDADGITGTATITVTVTNVNEAPAFATATALAISVPEGTTGNVGSPVTATDPEGASLAYSLTGTDAASFDVSSTGQISAASGTTLNHEQKARYAFSVVVSDGATPALTATRAVTVTVTDVDESLTITGLANGTVAENAVYTSPAPTVSGHRGAVTWTKEGTDAADFTISGSGVLSMVARDYEDPADDDENNLYEVTVKATDADGIAGTAAITVTVTNVNEAPAFATATALAISVPEGTTGNVGSPVTATDPEGASLAYSLTGTDAASFDVSSTGQISVASGTTLNHEQKASYAFSVVVSDGATPALTATRAVTVTVTDVDESLTITGLANGTVAENAVYASAAPTVTGHRGAVTWTKEGTDAADFTISASGVLSMVARDYEDPADDDENNVYEVTVKATDADNITGTAAITVTVTNVNEAPAFATATALAISVPEGTTGNIGSPVAASDPEGASLTYSLTGTDAASFDVSSAGQLSLASGTTLNHEQKASYSFNVVVSDGATPALTATRAVTVTVTDVDESLTITGLANGTVAENAVYASAAPTVTGHRGAVTWTKEGTDAADFTISGSGVLSMVARDYEDPADDDENNVYEVTVKATDADDITGTAAITVTVTDVNEAPAFATAAALAISVPEGTTGNIGSPATASDPEGASLAYSLTGTDAASFNVSSTGQISVASGTTLNHEQKARYAFSVVVSDGATPALTATRAVTVTVTDVDESLTIAGLANGTVAENAVYTSAAPTVTGHRGAVTWTKEGTDAADFTISSSGVLSMVARDYEDPVDDDEDNVYEVTVKATDADGITGTAAITVTVTNVNEAPAFNTATALAISVPEGTTGNIGSPVAASDPEGASLAYSLTGTDAASFDVSSTGQISVASGTTLNHEQKSSYSLTVVASDGATPALTATRAVTVTVTDVDESLTITGLANGTVAENAVYTSPAPTVSGYRGAVTWTKEGTDAADFTISSSGVLSMVARDHEDPVDDDEDNVYEVTVKATDADNITGTAAITVTVTNVNEAPAFATATALAISVPEGTTGNIGSPVAASDPEGASLTYSFAGADAASFDVSSTGQMSVASGTTLNHEQKASYAFSVVVSDGATPALTATRAVTVTVTDVDESLTITGLANGTVAENAVYASAAPTVTGHRGAVTWTKEGTDAADFTISASGVLSMVARDYEDPADDDENNVYEVTVKATDADNITGTAAITVTVTNVNEAPAFATATALAISVPEGTTGNIGSPVAASDPEGASLTYSLTGTDAASFDVSSAGQLSLASGVTLNHEQKASYSFNVVVSDGATPALTATRAVTVTVTDVDESLTITGLANGTVAENAVYASAAPTVTGHRGAVTWTKEGTDAADFTISGSGVLSMVARDYEDPADDDENNVYEVTVKATDADNITGTAAITVTVTNVNEAPAFATATALAISVPEGTTGNIGSPVAASDPEGATLTYSLTGTDASSFAVSSTGQLSVASGTTLNHEQKASYAFNVVASDGATPALTATRAVTVTVTDVDESLTITGLANGTVAENAVYTSAAPTVSGHRGAVTWTKEGTDAADFTISASGVLSMVARDYEDPVDDNEDNVYEVTVKATDADDITGTAAITVTVTDVNEAPAFATAAALAISVPEGTTGNIGSPATASDPEGASLAYSLTGTDAASFDVSSTGQISVASGTTLNHEQKARYAFSVVVSDGATPALTATRAVTVTVTDVDESLTIAGLANGTVAENAVYTSAAPTVSGHRGPVTWTKEGTDAADFTISASGVLSMVARDYEDPADDDEDNVYEVTVKATDADDITGTAAITVTVTNVNEAPAFATATALAISVPEGTTGNIGSPVTASDPEGASLAYSLTGTDASSFDVSSTGQLSVASGTTLNHEQKASYSFNVVVSDGATPALTATRAVTVTVTDVDESLTITGLANGTVAENAVYASPAPTVSGHRGAVTWTKEGTDAADFTISSSGVLSMVARDYEDPADDDQNNVYEVTVKATDADGTTGTAAITVTVTNVNEAPAFATATALAISVPEGTTGNIGSPVAASDPEGASLAYSLTGTDAVSFDIDAATGQLSVRADASLDYETRTSYAFDLVVSDGGAPPLSASRPVEVEVTDVFEAVDPPPQPPVDPPPPANRPPEFTPATPLAISVPEDAAGDIGAPVTATDPDEDDLTYSLAGEDAGVFGIDPETAQILVAAGAGLDYENRPFHVFSVVASDGNLTASREVAVLVIEPDRPVPPTAPTAPAAPTGLDAALLTSTAALLTWSDNSDNEAGFVVLHRTGGVDWNTLRSLPADARTATIDALEAGFVHEFLIAAVNAAGSAASNVAALSLALAPPTHLDSEVAGPDGVRLTWRDNSVSETGFAVQYRNGSGEEWTAAAPLAPNATSTGLEGLEPGARYLFRVGALSPAGDAFSQPGAFTLHAPPEPGTMTDCAPNQVATTLNGGYDVRMCFETPSGAQMDASNYHLEATASGLLYFFDRDNVEVLVKVLDGCAINGHRWVFVAPVTTLAFSLEITERATGRRFAHRNPKSLTAETRADTAAFPCDPESRAAAALGAAYPETTAGEAPAGAGAGASRTGLDDANPPAAPDPSTAAAIGIAAGADQPAAPVCEPDGPGIVLEDGHRVDMCFALPDGEIRQARDWGLPRRATALLHFFDRENAEVLVKVLDGCAINGHRWVFAAPVTDLGFRLLVTAPDGETWRHENAAGHTAEPRGDTAAFPCR